MIAEVRLWGRTIGAVSMDDGRGHATFQYTPEFAHSGIRRGTAPLNAYALMAKTAGITKRDRFLRADTRAAGRSAGLKQGRADALLDEVTAAVERWPEAAARVGVPDEVAEKIRKAHRLEL